MIKESNIFGKEIIFFDLTVNVDDIWVDQLPIYQRFDRFLGVIDEFKRAIIIILSQNGCKLGRLLLFVTTCLHTLNETDENYPHTESLN